MRSSYTYLKQINIHYTLIYKPCNTKNVRTNNLVILMQHLGANKFTDIHNPWQFLLPPNINRQITKENSCDAFMRFLFDIYTLHTYSHVPYMPSCPHLSPATHRPIPREGYLGLTFYNIHLTYLYWNISAERFNSHIRSWPLRKRYFN